MLPHVINEKRVLRILCADDDKPVGDMLMLYLAHAGHTVEHVTDGLEAWEKMSKDLGHFDVLITDNDMPGLRGVELVELLRQTDYRGRIIVHSGSLSPKEAEGYRAFRVDSIITKPIMAEKLLNVIESFYLKQAGALA